MFGLGIGALGAVRGSSSFDASDLTYGTLLLDFISPPPLTLDLNFASGAYRVWQSDPSTPALTGNYQVKG